MKIWTNSRSRRDNKPYLTIFEGNKASLSKGAQALLTNSEIVLGYEDDLLPAFAIICEEKPRQYSEAYTIKKGRLNATSFFKWLKVRPGRYEITSVEKGVLEVVITKEDRI